MRIEPLSIAGAALIHLEPHADDRGFFARSFCETEFAAAGLETRFPQANLSLSKQRGTLRGMHYQLPPHAETKLVRCTRGALFDAIVDLRPQSPSFGQWTGAELTADNRVAIYVPAGCAHGFQTLADDTEASYMVSAAYAPGSERGLRFDDPWCGIDWPMTPTDMSDKDRTWPLFNTDYHAVERFRDPG